MEEVNKKCKKHVKRAIIIMIIAFAVAIAIDAKMGRKESKYGEYKPGRIQREEDNTIPAAGIGRYF